MDRALDVARYIIHTIRPVSNLRLQPLLYLAWVDYYRHTGQPLFDSEIHAWRLGPVVPEVYFVFCLYAGNTIDDCGPVDLEADMRILDAFMERHTREPTAALLARTQRPGGAWDKIYRHGAGNRDTIPYPIIRQTERV